MSRKRLAAGLAALLVAVPGAALASGDALFVTEQVVEGHTVFALVEQVNNVPFAAIAGKAAQRTTLGAVEWFGGQNLFDDSVDTERSVGAYVIATEAGMDAPTLHWGADCGTGCASYVESYQFADPNGRTWIVDRYQWRECGTWAGGSFHILPCEVSDNATAAEGAVESNDGDGVWPPDLEGDGRAEADVPELEVRRSMFVVQIDQPGVDAAQGCDGVPATGQTYNFVNLVRLDALSNVQAGATTADPRTADIDLWFSDGRPPEPDLRDIVLNDGVAAQVCPAP